MSLVSGPPMITTDILAKRRCNASSWFCALAPELIGQILLYARDNRLEPSLHDWLPGNWMAWLPAAHICHYIRSVALATPLLWDHIYVQERDASMAFLERSREVPIDVKVNRRAKLSMVKQVLRQLPRLRSLLMDKSKIFKSPEEASWLSSSAPHLVSLQLCQGDDYDPQYASIHEVMLSRHMPLLQSLSVEIPGWCWMDSGSPLPTTLTQLSVFTGFPWMLKKTLARKTLSVLSGLSRLEVLILLDLVVQGNRGDPNFAESTDPTKVSLPKLRSLTCGRSILPSLRLLDCLTIPTTCKIFVEAIFTDYDLGHLPMLVSLFNKNIFVAGAGARPFVELCVSQWNEHRSPLCVRAFRTERPPRPADSCSSGAEFVLKCYMAGRQTFNWSYVMYHIVGAVNLTSVRILEFPSLTDVGQLDYRHALRQMTAIETIRFGEGWRFFQLLQVLPTFWRNGDGSGNDETHIFLPRLRRLVFSHVEFDLYPSKSHGDDFVQRLQERRKRGAGIATITLRCCKNMTPEITAMMRREVGQVCEETCSPEEHMNTALDRYEHFDS